MGASSSGSLWQQFVDQFATGSAADLGDVGDVPRLLWTGVANQLPITVPVVSGLQSLQVAPSDSLPLMWTQPAASTGLTTGPTLTDVAPPTAISGAGIFGASSSSNLPLAGAGSHS